MNARTGTTTEHAHSATIPQCLSARRNFNDWWRKLQEQYENKGCPLTAHEQTELLAMLARNPFAAVDKLKYSVVNFDKSYATLLAPQEKTVGEHILIFRANASDDKRSDSRKVDGSTSST